MTTDNDGSTPMRTYNYGHPWTHEPRQIKTLCNDIIWYRTAWNGVQEITYFFDQNENYIQDCPTCGRRLNFQAMMEYRIE